MAHFAPNSSPEALPAPPVAGGGCGGCWAAGYCAAYAPGSAQVPAACPLIVPPARQRRAARRAQGTTTA